jgi:hypothetical protein
MSIKQFFYYLRQIVHFHAELFGRFDMYRGVDGTPRICYNHVRKIGFFEKERLMSGKMSDSIWAIAEKRSVSSGAVSRTLNSALSGKTM